MRRGRALSRLVVLGVFAGALVPVPASAEPQQSAPTSCEVHELPVPPGTNGASVIGASTDGRTLLGNATTQDNGHTVVLWRDGKIVETIKDTPGDPSDMNADGVAVGGFFDEYTDTRPWVYDGEVRVLPGDVTPRAINDAGQIVGYRAAPSGGRNATIPVTWSPGADRPKDLLPQPSGIAYDVSGNGTIVGEVTGDAGKEAFVWRPDGTSGPLPRPKGMKTEDDLTAYKISGPWVVGSGSAGTVRWNLDTGAVETIDGVSVLDTNAINEQGWIAGQRQSGNQAVMIADGADIPLPGLGDGFVHYAKSISPDGSVIGGSAVIPKGPSKPIYWTCS